MPVARTVADGRLAWFTDAQYQIELVTGRAIPYVVPDEEEEVMAKVVNSSNVKKKPAAKGAGVGVLEIPAPAKQPAPTIEWVVPVPAGYVPTHFNFWRKDLERSISADTWICAYCSVRATVLSPNTSGEGVVLKAGCSCVLHPKCGCYLSVAAHLRKWTRTCGDCPKCCRCWACPTCQAVVTRTAQNEKKRLGTKCCGTCDKCCKCEKCETCGASVSMKQRCPLPGCDSTQKHHATCCDSDSRIALAISWDRALWLPRLPHFHTGTNFMSNRCRRHLSIESEVDSGFTGGSAPMPAFHQMLKRWKHGIVADMSIVCPPGFEVNTAPSSGDKFEAMVRELAGFYASYGASASEACGMHVHVDARDYHYPDLVNLIHLYSKVELALFAMLPPWRRFSHFAAPCAAKLMQMVAKLPKEGFIEMMKSPEFNSKEMKKKSAVAVSLARRLYGKDNTYEMKSSRDPKRGVAQDVRYGALNIHSWIRMKTIEFRLHHGTTALEDMMLWPQVLGTIIEFAKRTPLKVIKRLPSNPMLALKEVLEPRSWCHPRLWAYAERKQKENCPDYNETWAVMEKAGVVLPFHLSHPELGVLGWSKAKKAFTYVSRAPSERDKFREDYARFASANELIKGLEGVKVAWTFMPPVPTPEEIAAKVAAAAMMAGHWTAAEIAVNPALGDPRMSFPRLPRGIGFNAFGGRQRDNEYHDYPFGNRFIGFFGSRADADNVAAWFKGENEKLLARMRPVVSGAIFGRSIED